MARLKWEDRQYNGYFTMPGIGSRPRTRTDKDLKRRLSILGFRSYWRKLEIYRKSLLARINGKRNGDCLSPDLKEESLHSELRIMLNNLKGEVSSDSPGGVKHLLKMIEEIIRLISRVFHPSFQSLTPCFAGGTLSSVSSPRGPPSLVAAPFKVRYSTQAKACGYHLQRTDHCLQSSPGPGNWIQTRPRILEICLKLKTIISTPNQAPDSGSYFTDANILNSFLYKAYGMLLKAITAGTKMILSHFAEVGRKVPRLLGGSLYYKMTSENIEEIVENVLDSPETNSHVSLKKPSFWKKSERFATLGLAGLMGYVGALAIPTSAEAATGDFISEWNIDNGQSPEELVVLMILLITSFII